MKFTEEKTIDGVRYTIIDESQVRDYVVKIANEEWDESDFPKYGDDLFGSIWLLEEVEVAKIKANQAKLETRKFQNDLRPRIIKIHEILNKKEVIPPLILRGSDFLIFDGYARFHALKDKNVKRCLAYVGRK